MRLWVSCVILEQEQEQERGARAKMLGSAMLAEVTGVMEALVSHLAAHKLELRRAQEARGVTHFEATHAASAADALLSILLPQQASEEGQGGCRCVLELTLDLDFSELRDDEAKQLELQKQLVLDLARALQAHVTVCLLHVLSIVRYYQCTDHV
jgi:ABC-type branched-subunit amino acid transport system ATPase component